MIKVLERIETPVGKALQREASKKHASWTKLASPHGSLSLKVGGKAVHGAKSKKYVRKKG